MSKDVKRLKVTSSLGPHEVTEKMVQVTDGKGNCTTSCLVTWWHEVTVVDEADGTLNSAEEPE